MDIHTPLFEGKLVRLAPVDYDHDPEVESRWTHNPLYLRMLSPEPALPLSPEQIKKKYEKLEKKAEENQNLFHFAIRTLEPDDRLIGFVELYWIEWAQGNAMIRLGIGDPQDWGQGFGTDTLNLMLRYAFGELNLRRLTAYIPEYNQAALGLFGRLGFVEEVRRREALNRDGRRWDMLHYGILRDEWREFVA